MKNLVIFSVEELYDLIHDKPVTDEKSGIIYMSIDCYEKEWTKMSDYGVKETQCTRCEHREVCSLKTEFLEAQKAIDEVYVSRPCEDGKKVSMIRVRDIKHIEPVELRCKHYIPNTGVNIR